MVKQVVFNFSSQPTGGDLWAGLHVSYCELASLCTMLKRLFWSSYLVLLVLQPLPLAADRTVDNKLPMLQNNLLGLELKRQNNTHQPNNNKTAQFNT